MKMLDRICYWITLQVLEIRRRNTSVRLAEILNRVACQLPLLEDPKTFGEAHKRIQQLESKAALYDTELADIECSIRKFQKKIDQL